MPCEMHEPISNWWALDWRRLIIEMFIFVNNEMWCFSKYVDYAAKYQTMLAYAMLYYV